MGVPKFYRWISERFPQINQLLTGATILPEFDNFYLDMNGIIHACTHPNENVVANSLTMREMILAIFRYIDRMVTDIVKPKKILFMAIDGVAPRAKLNQQRARRFRAAQDRIESVEKARKDGNEVDEKVMFDSNCITPGTEFMEKVGKYLKYFIRKKMKEDPLWRNLKIVFSGHDVPGEGEHKIMQFIRELRADPDYQPNQRHCMYGQDADLIMLGLASHEPHFALLREVVNFKSFNDSRSTRQTVLRQTKDAQFQLLHLSLLREYITVDFALEINNWVVDQERLIDDFIFLTFLVGNDFLPHLPTLDISEHAFDVLIDAYRELMRAEPGYIVHNGEIGDLDRLERLFNIIGVQEYDILQRREINEKKYQKRRHVVEDEDSDSENDVEESEEMLQEAYEEAVRQIAMGIKEDSSEWQIIGRPKRAKSDLDSEDDELVVNKDYRGRYYYDKFKVLVNAGNDTAQVFLADLRAHYIRGLMWCLAYYIKGCISWTWYYPYHYGPMLGDMVGLASIVSTVQFEIGQPFLPFQQLLGCLPPASSNLLPQQYQWLMTSSDSPVRGFYPLEFKIDQNGKKNPWEAVVVLDFIDEKLLLEAERIHCPASKLTKEERARNVFGAVLSHHFDPYAVNTYFSNDDELKLPDIPQCQTVVTESVPNLVPVTFFKPVLLDGTTFPIAGFPSLTILPVKGFKAQFAKVNMFGTASKYKTLLIEIESQKIVDIDALNPQSLLGRSVFVNYPQNHEARVVSVSCGDCEYRFEPVDKNAPVSDEQPSVVVKKVHDEMTRNKWKRDAAAEEEKYRSGRGTPGSGGIIIGEVTIKLRVVPLQGVERNPITGSGRKKFGTIEADVPIQMALWIPPVVDTRFQESGELPAEDLMPVGSEVIAIAGDLLGCKGTVLAPQKQQNRRPAKRVVDVEFLVPPEAEVPFGYKFANELSDEFYTSKDLCSVLKISPSVLGKIVGSIKLANRMDIGLNLKRNGQYQFSGYTRRVEYNKPKVGAERRKVWVGSDTIQIVGSDINSSEAAAVEAENCGWEYTPAAASLIHDYKAKFPALFSKLEELPHQPVYACDQLFGAAGGGGGETAAAVTDWMKAQPFFNLPRTPFSTQCLSKPAMMAIERAADLQTLNYEKKGYKSIIVQGVPVEKLYCDFHRTPNDTALKINVLEPRLGDRVVNLTSDGVPFGLRGTVITIHNSTNYVEILFDSEFIGGKALQGSCSQFRGKLCPWTCLILISRPEEFRQHVVTSQQKRLNAAALRAALFVFSDGHVKGSFPGRATAAVGDPTAQKGHVTELTKHSKQRSVGPTVTVESAQQKNSSMLLHALKLNSDSSSSSSSSSMGSTSTTALTSLLKSSLKISSSGDAAAVEKKENVLALLKRQLNIPTVKYSDEGDDVIIGEGIDLNATQSEGASSKSSPRAAALSNGSGQRILEDAASTAPVVDPSLSSRDSLAGVVSYAPMSANTISLLNLSLRKSAAAIASPPADGVDRKATAPYTPPAAKKVVLNKPAVMRIVKHELQPNTVIDNKSSNNDSNEDFHPQKQKQGASPPQRKSRHITEILQKAKEDAKEDTDRASAVTQPSSADGSSGPGKQIVEITSILKNAKRVQHLPKSKPNDTSSPVLDPADEIPGHHSKALPAKKASPIKEVTPRGISKAEHDVDTTTIVQVLDFSTDKSEELSQALQSRLQAIAVTASNEPSQRTTNNRNNAERRNRGKKENDGKVQAIAQNLVPSRVILQRSKASAP